MSLTFSQPSWAGTETAKNTPPKSSEKEQHLGADFITAVEEVAQRVGPTVVSIRTERTQRYRGAPGSGYSFGSPFEDEFFNRFFEDFFGDQYQHDQYQQEYKSGGLGSGVIIDAKGYILTNEHVIDAADTIMVRLSDGREAKASLIGTDPRSDLAVVKIDLPNLPSAKLGDSDILKIGQWVVAIGNPFGHILSNPEPTVTTGVVSALQRSLPRTSRRDTDYTDLIQTDAAINPGNSGGPLVNLNGEIVGINVAIFSTSGGYQGIGFAIPISHAKRIIDQLIKGEKVSYGWIGVSVQDIDRRLSEYFGLNNTDGVLISEVLSGAPAAQAGIQNGDIVLSVNGEKTKNTASLIQLIGNSPIGKKADLSVLRNGKNLTVPVVIQRRPDFDEEGRMISNEGEESPSDETEPPVEENKEWRGLNIRSIPPEISGRMPEAASGVVIVDIKSGSPAEETGLRKGDIVIRVNQEPVKNPGDFYRAVKTVRGDCLIQTLRGFFVIKAK